MTDKIVVLTTCDSAEQARRIARRLVEQRVAACVSVVPGLRSLYRWQGEITEEREQLLLIKSRRELFEALRAELEKIHPYEVPEVLALPVVEGAEAYLNWMEEQLR